MKNYIIILSFLMSIPFLSFAQNDRIPFVSKGKYGIVDENGKTIIPFKYDNVVIEKRYKVIKVLLNDLWGIYDMDGVKILDHVIKETKNYGAIGPVIGEVKNKAGTNYYKEEAPTDLLSIMDTYAKVKYLINPNTPKKINKAYKAKDKPSKNPASFIYHPVTNRYVVTNRDNTMSVIDSTGKEVTNKAVEDLYLLTEDFLAIGQNDLFALFKGNQKITDYKYKSFQQIDINGLFYGTHEEDRGNSYPTKVFHLFDRDGNIIAKTEKYIKIMNDMILIQDQNNDSHIYDFDVNKVHTFKNTSASWIRVGEKAYLNNTGRRYSGIFDVDGTILLDSVYNNIKSNTQFLHCTLGKTHSVLDTNFNTLIACDTVYSIEGTKKEGVFLYTVQDQNYNRLSGLMDADQKTIIPANWQSIHIYSCTDLITLNNKGNYVLRDLSSGKDVAKSNVERIAVLCEKEKIMVGSSTQKATLDLQGNEVDVFKYKRRYQDPIFETKYVAKKQGGKYTLVDKEGVIVSAKKYESIDIITDPKTKKTAYFCAFAENVHPSVVVFDDNLDQIGQPGYSIAERWVRYMKYNPGTIFVGHDADISKNKYQFRSGIIDYEGNWIVEPFMGLFTFIQKDVYLVTNYDLKKRVFYNSKGEIVNTRDYDIIKERSGSDYFQNRIPVGVLQDRSYLDKLKKVAEEMDKDYVEDEDIQVSIEKIKKQNEKIEALGEPDVLFGYVNKQGVEIIPPKYIKAEGFGMSDPYAVVSEKDNEGNVFTHMIDTMGNIQFSVPYESLYKINSGYYSCQSNGLYGLVDSTGNPKTPFIYKDKVYGLSGFDMFQTKDSLYHYIIDKNFKTHPIELSSRMEVKKINDDFLYAKLQYKIPETYKYNFKFLLFTKDLELIDTFENIQQILPKFNNKELPPNYLVLQRKDMPDVVYNVDKRELLQN